MVSILELRYIYDNYIVISIMVKYPSVHIDKGLRIL